MSRASFARRPDAKTSRSNRRAETARDIYTATPEKRAQIIRNQQGLARTQRARQNWIQTRDQRVKNAAGTGMRPVKVGNTATKPAKGSAAAQKIEQAKGRTKVLTQSKNALNQQLKSINAQIKQAGPSAGGLRLQKLQIQDRLSQLRRDIAASKAAARG
jgi:hypothetical protein